MAAMHNTVDKETKMAEACSGHLVLLLPALCCPSTMVGGSAHAQLLVVQDTAVLAAVATWESRDAAPGRLSRRRSVAQAGFALFDRRR